MRRINPNIIPRNHLVEDALFAAENNDDLGPFNELLAAIKHPFDVDQMNETFRKPPPLELQRCYRTFCGT